MKSIKDVQAEYYTVLKDFFTPSTRDDEVEPSTDELISRIVSSYSVRWGDGMVTFVNDPPKQEREWPSLYLRKIEEGEHEHRYERRLADIQAEYALVLVDNSREHTIAIMRRKPHPGAILLLEETGRLSGSFKIAASVVINLLKREFSYARISTP